MSKLMWASSASLESDDYDQIAERAKQPVGEGRIHNTVALCLYHPACAQQPVLKGVWEMVGLGVGKDLGSASS